MFLVQKCFLEKVSTSFPVGQALYSRSIIYVFFLPKLINSTAPDKASDSCAMIDNTALDITATVIAGEK